MCAKLLKSDNHIYMSHVTYACAKLFELRADLCFHLRIGALAANARAHNIIRTFDQQLNLSLNKTPINKGVSICFS